MTGFILKDYASAARGPLVGTLMTMLSAMTILSGAALAQDAEKPLDLTILSTNEDNVSFVIIEGDAPVFDTQDGNALQTGDTKDTIAEKRIDNGTDSGLVPANEDDVLIQDDEAKAEEISSQDNQSQIAQTPSLQEADTNSDQPATGRMKRRNIKDVGLASIGIGQMSEGVLDELDNRLWRGVSLARAMRLIDSVPEVISSASLRHMSYQAIARQGVPPKGASDNPMALLSARMGYLARTGRSQALADIITQLPTNEDWQDWHEWKIFYDLMMRDDEQACSIAAENASSSLDPLWQKTNLMCQILTGDEARAAFSSDVLKASGLIDDPIYFDLIDVLLRRKSIEEVQEKANQIQQVDITHIILMDAAHVEITEAQLANLDASYGEAANNLRYLTIEARQNLGMGNRRAGLISQEAAKALFVSATDDGDSPLRAMTRRLESEDDSASVSLYLAIRNQAMSADTLSEDDARELIMLIIQAVRLEADLPDGALWLSYYAPLLRDVMAVVDMRALDEGVQSAYAMIMGLAGLPLTPLPTDGQAVVMADHISIALSGTQAVAERINSLIQLELSPLIPLFAKAWDTDQDWLMLYDTQNETSDSYVPLSAVGLGALRQAAASGQRVESVIIAARLIENRALHEISQHEAAQIAILLEQAGLTKTAMAFREEVFMAHVMKALFAAKADIS